MSVSPQNVVPAWVSDGSASLLHFPVIRSPSSKTSEAFRSLHSQAYLNWLNKAGGGSVVAVVSPDRGEGRTFIACNLAVMFAQGGSRCLLIEGDMRYPKMRDLFGLPNNDGLSTTLRDRRHIDSFYAVYAMRGLENLSVMPAGPVPENPHALLQKASFASLMNFAAQSYDVVIVDTPAGSLFDDAQIIASAARGALLVCRKGLSKTARASAYIRQLSNLGVHTIGATLTAG